MNKWVAKSVTFDPDDFTAAAHRAKKWMKCEDHNYSPEHLRGACQLEYLGYMLQSLVCLCTCAV